MRIALLIVFGTAGTLSRYWMQGFVQQRTSSTYPYGTLLVNLAGCFLLGTIAQYALAHLTIPPEWRTAITVGFIGSFTTFSTFVFEMAKMAEDGEWIRTTTYLVASVLGGLIAVFAGMRVGNHI